MYTAKRASAARRRAKRVQKERAQREGERSEKASEGAQRVTSPGPSPLLKPCGLIPPNREFPEYRFRILNRPLSENDLGAGRIFALLFPLQIAIFKAMPRLTIEAWTKNSAERVGRLIERKIIETGANFARSHLQKLWDRTYSLYNVLTAL